MSPRKPLFSVVIPTRQRHDTLFHAMRTVLMQDHDSFELVVMDNMSSPETADVVHGFQDPRVRYFRSPERLAMSDNWELALSHATGTYVTILGDDDGLLPNALGKAEQLLTYSSSPILAWDRPNYFWPNAHLPWLRNRLSFHAEDQVAEIDGKDILRKLYAYQTPFFNLPMLYNAFVHRKVIDEVSAKTGRYFNDLCPDVYSGVVNAYVGGRYLFCTSGLGISGASGHSTGASYASNQRDGTSAAMFDEELKKSSFDSSRHPWLTEANDVNIGIANTLLRTKEKFFPHDESIEWELAGLLRAMGRCLNNDPEAYDQMANDLLALAHKHGLAIYREHLPPKISQPPAGPVGRAGVKIWLDCAPLHVTNIYEAAQALGAINQFRATLSSDAARAVSQPAASAQPSEPLPSAPMPQAGALPVRWEGEQFNYHSFAHVNREFARRLISSGQVELQAVSPVPAEFKPSAQFESVGRALAHRLKSSPAVTVRHQWPPNFNPPEEGAWVMMQPWEFGGLPDEWIAGMRDQVDEMWVYSNWLRDCYIQSGLPADRVHVVPCGVDIERFSPQGPQYPLKTTKRFKFLFLGGTIRRKGIDVLLNTYFNTFTADDDVCLVIKGLGTSSFYGNDPTHQAILRVLDLAKSNPRMPALEYLTDNLTDEDVAAVYRACDALVHPYRGEGFGMPMAEAMASALPVIATGYGACRDFLDDETGYLIPAQVVPAPEAELPPGRVGYWWAEPDTQALAALMRHLVAHPAEARLVGERARRRIVEHFTWDHAAEVALGRLMGLTSQVPVRKKPLHPFRPGLAPWPLDEHRRVVFFHQLDWRRNDWQEVLKAYLRAFGPEADATLALWLDPASGVSAEAASEALLTVIAESGADPNHTPDLLLVTDPLDEADLARLYTAADVVVPGEDTHQIERAGMVEKPILKDLSPETWREVLAAKIARAS